MVDARRAILRGRSQYARLRIEPENRRRAALHGPTVDRPLLRTGRQERRSRQARPTFADARARRTGLRCADERPSVQALALRDRSRPERRRLRLFYDTLSSATFDLGCE